MPDYTSVGSPNYAIPMVNFDVTNDDKKQQQPQPQQQQQGQPQQRQMSLADRLRLFLQGGGQQAPGQPMDIGSPAAGQPFRVDVNGNPIGVQTLPTTGIY
jgi:hypothetical protein